MLSSPVWLYQLWAFVTPALYSKERRYAITFVSCGGLLFAIGAVLAYVVIREGLTVLLSFGGDATIAALSPDSYFSFLIAMLIIFGVSFELPLLLIMLNQIGMISSAKLSKWRRYSIFGMVVFAGLVVPGNDPVTMLALAMALILLYELSVQVTRIHDRRAAQARRVGGACRRRGLRAAGDGRRRHPATRTWSPRRWRPPGPSRRRNPCRPGRPRSARWSAARRPRRRHLIQRRPCLRRRVIPFGRCRDSASAV